MSLSAHGGITYQYYNGVPLWPFGWGLSYTSFDLKWLSSNKLSVAKDLLEHQQYEISVTNTGNVTSDVTVLAYFMSDSSIAIAASRQPKKELFAFCRMRALQPGTSHPCSLALST